MKISFGLLAIVTLVSASMKVSAHTPEGPQADASGVFVFSTQDSNTIVDLIYRGQRHRASGPSDENELYRYNENDTDLIGPLRIDALTQFPGGFEVGGFKPENTARFGGKGEDRSLIQHSDVPRLIAIIKSYKESNFSIVDFSSISPEQTQAQQIKGLFGSQSKPEAYKIFIDCMKDLGKWQCTGNPKLQ